VATNGEAADLTTIPGASPKPERRNGRIPALTVVFHPGHPSRAGDLARLSPLAEGRACDLSRLAPEFFSAAGGAHGPLADRHLSRTPVKLSPLGRGLRLEGRGSDLLVDGQPLAGAREVTREELERGLVLVLGNRVVLLLHLVGAPTPRQPRLGMVGDSEALERVRAEVVRVAHLEVPVLLTGESGTGKEIAARALAAAGARAEGPFVPVNLAAVPASIAASELFGHAPGALTGAGRPHVSAGT